MEIYPELLDSDGSDYDIEVDDGNTDEDMSDCESLASFESEEFFPPPETPDHVNISVEELERILRTHKEEGTVRSFLTKVDTSDERNGFIATYANPTVLFERPKPIRKIYGNVLHFACHDPDAQRQLEKIKLILNAAKRAHIDCADLLALKEVVYNRDETVWSTSWSDENQLKMVQGECMTPLRILLQDMGRCNLESVKLLCDTWPDAVCCRPTVEDFESTTLMDVFNHRFDLSENAVEKRVAVSKILLDAAEKTPLGARGLVSATQSLKCGVNIGTEHWGDVRENHTVIHIICSRTKSPERFLPMFLQAWPEALKICNECSDYEASFPFHDLASWGHARFTRSLEAVLSYSTIEAIAVALLQVSCDKTGFHVMQQCIEHEWNVTTKTQMQRLLVDYVHKKDPHGRSLLHYVAAAEPTVSPNKEGKLSYMAHEELRRNGVAVDHDKDPSDAVHLRFEKKLETEKTRQKDYIDEVCQWILGIDPSLAYAVDKDGMNPFHFAIRQGKEWDDGLKRLSECVPEWPMSREKSNGLFPSLLAASSPTPDLNTIFELLRYNVGSTFSSFSS